MQEVAKGTFLAPTVEPEVGAEFSVTGPWGELLHHSRAGRTSTAVGIPLVVRRPRRDSGEHVCSLSVCRGVVVEVTTLVLVTTLPSSVEGTTHYPIVSLQ